MPITRLVAVPVSTARSFALAGTQVRSVEIAGGYDEIEAVTRRQATSDNGPVDRRTTLAVALCDLGDDWSDTRSTRCVNVRGVMSRISTTTWVSIGRTGPWRLGHDEMDECARRAYELIPVQTVGNLDSISVTPVNSASLLSRQTRDSRRQSTFASQARASIIISIVWLCAIS